MECSCINVDVDDHCELLSDKTVISKKEHQCVECRGLIKKGDNYRIETVVYDGDISHYKTCLICRSVRDEMFCDFIYGEIWDRLREEILESDGSMAWSHIARLIPEARNKVCDLIESYWTEEYGESKKYLTKYQHCAEITAQKCESSRPRPGRGG